jgi:hypothetical protein
MKNSETTDRDDIFKNFRRITTLLLFILLWLSILSFPYQVPGVSLDESWQASFAYFLNHGLQAGIDYVYNHGPLGYFSTNIYDPNLYWFAYAYQIIVQLLFVFLLAKLIRIRLHPAFAIFAIAVFTLFLGAVHRDAQKLFFLVVLGITLIDEDSSWIYKIASIILLSLFSMAKLLALGFAILIILCAEIIHRIRKFKTIVSPLPLFVITFFATYFLLGQSLASFPVFLHSSMETTLGYNAAMVLEGKQSQLFLSLAMLAMVLMLIFYTGLRNRNTTSVLKLVVISLGLLLSWKHGFTRQDNHTSIFFGYAIFSTLLLVLHFRNTVGRSRFVAGITVFAIITGGLSGLAGSAWSNPLSNIHAGWNLVKGCKNRTIFNARILLTPMATKTLLEQREKQLREQWFLPVITGCVQDRTTDIFSYLQEILFLNNMNWRPRPVFQSISAYTPYLAERNATFFRSPQAPDYLLFQMQTIDDRFPTIDDNLALFEILQRYAPVATERSLLLLKKEKPEQSPEFTTLKKQTIRFNEEFMLPQSFPYQILSLDIRPTLAGRLRANLFRSPYLWITVRTKSGNSSTFRLIPGPVQKGFLITPLARTTADFTRLFGLPSIDVVTSFTVKTDHPGRWFQDSIVMELRGTRSLSNRKLDPTKLSMIRDAILSGTSFDGKQQISMLPFTGGTPYQSDFQALYSNGVISTKPVVLPDGKYKLVIVGYGTKAGEEYPAIYLSLNGKQIGEFYLETDQKEFAFTASHNAPVQFSLQFHNDAVIGNGDRNVFIRAIYVVPFAEK